MPHVCTGKHQPVCITVNVRRGCRSCLESFLPYSPTGLSPEQASSSSCCSSHHGPVIRDTVTEAWLFCNLYLLSRCQHFCTFSTACTCDCNAYVCVTVQERMASEVADVEKKRNRGNVRAGKGATAGVTTNAQTTQTDTDTAELPNAAQQLNAELSVLQAEVQKKDHALAAAHALHSELRAAHDNVLRRALDAEPAQAENARLIEQARQAHSDAEADQQLKKKQTQEVEAISLELKHLQAQHAELQNQHACVHGVAKSLQASEAAHKAELQSMTQHAVAAQDSCSDLEAANLAAAQQLDQLQTRSSQLEQTQQQLQALIAEAAHQVQGMNAALRTPAPDGSLVSAAETLMKCMQRQDQEAKAEAVTLTQQLQEAQAAQALEVEQLRYDLN